MVRGEVTRSGVSGEGRGKMDQDRGRGVWKDGVGNCICLIRP